MLEKLFSGSRARDSSNALRDGELRAELNRSENLVGVLTFEQVSDALVEKLDFRGVTTSGISDGTSASAAFMRRSGASKFSRNVIKWFDVITMVQPNVLCFSCISKRPLADCTSDCSQSDATYSSGAANCRKPVFNINSKQCGRGDVTARRAPLHSDKHRVIVGSF